MRMTQQSFGRLIRICTKWLDNLEEKVDDKESNVISKLSEDVEEINKTDANRARDLITESRKVDACAILVNLACAEQNKVYMAQEHKNLYDAAMHCAYDEKSLQAR
mmetsp:Transcript_17978/g.20723  ORF Transcript_17978/g.20723 Transcript_17978/m.20723 type:complete len:106 (-) Transcript_17978:331-648(-)